MLLKMGTFASIVFKLELAKKVLKTYLCESCFKLELA